MMPHALTPRHGARSACRQGALRHLRKADARTIEDVDAALGALLDEINQTNAPDTSARRAIGQPQASVL
jgi:hypothetical protein